MTVAEDLKSFATKKALNNWGIATGTNSHTAAHTAAHTAFHPMHARKSTQRSKKLLLVGSSTGERVKESVLGWTFVFIAANEAWHASSHTAIS